MADRRQVHEPPFSKNATVYVTECIMSTPSAISLHPLSSLSTNKTTERRGSDHLCSKKLYSNCGKCGMPYVTWRSVALLRRVFSCSDQSVSSCRIVSISLMDAEGFAHQIPMLSTRVSLKSAVKSRWNSLLRECKFACSAIILISWTLDIRTSGHFTGSRPR